MKIAAPECCVLLVVDFQERLMPAIAEGEAAISNAGRLIRTADLLGVPVIYTEENPAGLGHTVAALAPGPSARVLAKMAFDAGVTGELAALLPDEAEIVAVGCETHVCLLQTVLGLLGGGRRVHVVRDAVGSRTVANREAALTRMARHGAEIVTAEMVGFEWLATAEHPGFRNVLEVMK